MSSGMSRDILSVSQPTGSVPLGRQLLWSSAVAGRLDYKKKNTFCSFACVHVKRDTVVRAFSSRKQEAPYTHKIIEDVSFLGGENMM